MHRAMTSPAAALLAGLSAGAAAADEPLSCWDGSFAYTTIGVRERDEGWQVRLATQDETVFAPLAPGADLDWGQATLDIPIPESGCRVDHERTLFSCAAEESAATLGLAPFGGNPERVIPVPMERVGVRFVGVSEAADPATGGPGRMLVLRAITGGAPVVLLLEFGEHTDCSGWPDAFDQR